MPAASRYKDVLSELPGCVIMAVYSQIDKSERHAAWVEGMQQLVAELAPGFETVKRGGVVKPVTSPGNTLTAVYLLKENGHMDRVTALAVLLFPEAV